MAIKVDPLLGDMKFWELRDNIDLVYDLKEIILFK